MSNNLTDLTFFTNDQNQTLVDRFKATLANTSLFDVLVGYFRSSGFYQLYESIEPVEETRALVGLRELTPITDSMSEEDKLAVIQREFESLYDPHHPVRNHFKILDSINVVRTIREALKR